MTQVGNELRQGIDVNSLHVQIVFKINFSKKLRVPNGLDPIYDRCFVGPDLDPNCLSRLSDNGKKCR